MCLAQGPQRSDAGEARTPGPRSRVKHSATEPLHSLIHCLETEKSLLDFHDLDLTFKVTIVLVI